MSLILCYLRRIFPLFVFRIRHGVAPKAPVVKMASSRPRQTGDKVPNFVWYVYACISLFNIKIACRGRRHVMDDGVAQQRKNGGNNRSRPIPAQLQECTLSKKQVRLIIYENLAAAVDPGFIFPSL